MENQLSIMWLILRPKASCLPRICRSVMCMMAQSKAKQQPTLWGALQTQTADLLIWHTTWLAGATCRFRSILNNILQIHDQHYIFWLANRQSPTKFICLSTDTGKPSIKSQISSEVDMTTNAFVRGPHINSNSSSLFTPSPDMEECDFDQPIQPPSIWS